jgi:hypothetical protein
MAKKKSGSSASGKFPKKAGRGTAQTLPPRPTHNRCGTCYQRYPKDLVRLVYVDGRLAPVKGCPNDHEALAGRNGIPLTPEALVKLRRAFRAGDIETAARIRPLYGRFGD